MIGIYALYWPDEEMVYVGQSTKIAARFYTHLYDMVNKRHSNYKIQKMYDIYGHPQTIVLEECLVSDLDCKEVSWILEFDSHNNGLNLTIGGNAPNGLDATTSKHSKFTILKIFSMLYKTTKTQADISRRLGVPKPTIAKLACGNSHLWLLEKYPQQYSKMIQSNASRSTVNRKGGLRGKVYPTIVGPDGVEYNITNVKGFCRNHPQLNVSGYTGLAQVMSGSKAQHMGFRLKNPTETTTTVSTYPTLLDPSGEKYENIVNVSHFCAKHPLLSGVDNASANLSRVLRGDQKIYLGFHLNL
jgi:hypothetical protein